LLPTAARRRNQAEKEVKQTVASLARRQAAAEEAKAVKAVKPQTRWTKKEENQKQNYRHLTFAVWRCRRFATVGRSATGIGCALHWTLARPHRFFPKSATYGEDIPRKQCGTPPRFRTATGELITADSRRRVRGVGEWGQRVGYTGWDTEVRKPLIAAGEVTDYGSLIILGKHGGHIIGNGMVKKAVMATLRKCLREDASSTIPVHKEAGVFNMYVQLDGKDDEKEICGQSEDEDQLPEFDMPLTPPRRGFPRQGKIHP